MGGGSGKAPGGGSFLLYSWAGLLVKGVLTLSGRGDGDRWLDWSGGRFLSSGATRGTGSIGWRILAIWWFTKISGLWG